MYSENTGRKTLTVFRVNVKMDKFFLRPASGTEGQVFVEVAPNPLAYLINLCTRCALYFAQRRFSSVGMKLSRRVSGIYRINTMKTEYAKVCRAVLTT